MSAQTSNDDPLGHVTLAHLEAVVAIDSASDEASTTIPSSAGQRVIAAFVGERFRAYGLTVSEDAQANVIGFLPGRAGGESAPAVALMVHLDTARGTAALPRLFLRPAWDGTALAFTANATIRVDCETYPQLARYVGHTIVHGTGDAPFGLDDKLGLAHILTLARALSERPEWPSPPLYFVGRPDEEIGRMEAVDALAEQFAALGVRSGYTVDGLLPYEVNTDNFNAAQASLTFAKRPMRLSNGAVRARVRLGGVNTHGATAHAEGHRAATRFAVEILARLAADGIAATATGFESDALRDCDAVFELAIDRDDAARVAAAIQAVVGPHVVRGATLSPLVIEEGGAEADGAVADLLAFVARFLASEPGFPLLCEDSHGWLGYSHPYRARANAAGGHILDIRIRDFDPALLTARKEHIVALATAADCIVKVRDQYINMGPSLAARPDLIEHAIAAGGEVGVAAERLPIRGGTGVDPFLARGTAIANLGTGYFAPESEKELTSIETMAGHARWLLALVRRLATPAAIC